MIFCLNGKHRSAQVAATCLGPFFKDTQSAFNEAIVSKSCHRGPLESTDHSSPRLGVAFPERPRGMGGMGMTPSDWFVFVSISRGCHAHCFPRRSPLGVCFALGLVSRWYGHPPQHRRTVMQRGWHTPRDRRHPGDALQELLRLLAEMWPRASAPLHRAVQAHHHRARPGLG